MKPSTRAVPPARSTSASSMQSPPASFGGHQGHHLVAGVRPARRIRRGRGASGGVGAGQGAGRGWREGSARHWPPGGGRPIWMRSGWLRGSIYRVLLFWDRFSVSKPLSQIQRRTLLFLQQASYTPSFGGLGQSVNRRQFLELPSRRGNTLQPHDATADHANCLSQTIGASCQSAGRHPGGPAPDPRCSSLPIGQNVPRCFRSA